MNEYKDGQMIENKTKQNKKKSQICLVNQIYDNVIFHTVDNSFINKSNELLLLRCYWN